MKALAGTSILLACLGLLSAAPVGAQPAPPEPPATAQAEPAAEPAAPATESAPAPAPEALAGTWVGALDVGTLTLRLVLDVEVADDGALRATLDSIDQGAAMVVDRIELEERTVSFAIDRINGSFRGTLADDGDSIEGVWSQGGILPLTFERSDERPTRERPQEPKPPFPYATRDVTFPGGDEGVRLAGTVVVPAGEGPFPAVVFATGSGPQDRDESLMGHRPFLVVADHLARHGIASLRYDDRGAGESTGDHLGSTVDDFADDLAAALAHLRAQPEVARGAAGIVGHSEGGLSALKVAAGAAEGAAPDFLVLLAPPGVPLTALLARQTRDLLGGSGLAPELVERLLENQQAELAILTEEGLTTEERRERLRAHAAGFVETIPEEDRPTLGLDPQTLETNIRQATSPWFLSLVAEDAARYLPAVRMPVLALFGERDLQVAAEENAAVFRSAFAASGHPDHEIAVLPELNHLFQHAETGRIDEYARIEETFAPEALELVSGWIGERFGSDAPDGDQDREAEDQAEDP